MSLSDTASKIKDLLNTLERDSPSATWELRNRLDEAYREIYDEGYSAGMDEGVLRATVPNEEFFLRGEAKGLAWASHAAAGGQMAPNTNPYVSPRIIARLLTMGEKAKLEKES